MRRYVRTFVYGSSEAWRIEGVDAAASLWDWDMWRRLNGCPVASPLLSSLLFPVVQRGGEGEWHEDDRARKVTDRRKDRCTLHWHCAAERRVTNTVRIYERRVFTSAWKTRPYCTHLNNTLTVNKQWRERWHLIAMMLNVRSSHFFSLTKW